MTTKKSRMKEEEFEMNENKENVKVLSKEDVIELSNYTKRQEFLGNYKSWGVWLDIPELNAQVFKAELPNSKVIFVTLFKNHMSYGGEYSSPVYRYAESPDAYHAHEDSWPFIAEKLKKLKKRFLEEKKNETSDTKN